MYKDGKSAEKERGITLNDARKASAGSSRRALLVGLTTFSVAMAAQASQIASAKSHDHHKRRHFRQNHKKHHARGNCYLEGTLILTPNGEVAVETLKAGDLVQLHDKRSVPIKWVGSRTLMRDEDSRWDIRLAPICLKRGSLAQNTPHTDLYVSRAHCFLIDGFLVPAATLVNWRSISACTDFDAPKLTYFHIELEKHSIIVANGAPAETLLPGSDMDGFEYAPASAAGPGILAPCAPIIGLQGAGQKAASIARSVLAPLLDIRYPIDRIRDALHDRAVMTALS
jgi:Hint domain